MEGRAGAWAAIENDVRRSFVIRSAFDAPKRWVEQNKTSTLLRQIDVVSKSRWRWLYPQGLSLYYPISCCLTEHLVRAQCNDFVGPLSAFSLKTMAVHSQK